MRSLRSKTAFVLILLFIFSSGLGLVWAVEEHGEEHAVHKVHYTKSQFFDLIKRAVNFGLFIGILVYLARKPIGKMLRERREGVKQTLEEVEQQKQEARKKYLEYEAKLAQLDKEREKIIDMFIAEGEKEGQRIVEEAKKAAEGIKAGAKVTVEQETRAARAQIRGDVAELATKLAGDMIKQRFTKADQDRLIDEYLAKMEG
jgi:F-type H+-transporting ATPase subunit b